MQKTKSIVHGQSVASILLAAVIVLTLALFMFLSPSLVGAVTVSITPSSANIYPGDSPTPLPTPAPIPVPVTVDISNLVLDNGLFLYPVAFFTPDGMLLLNIDDHTISLTPDYSPLQYIGVVTCVEPPPDPPAGKYIIGCAYDLLPEGATFSPKATITLKYDSALVPDGVPEENLAIAYYDRVIGQWVESVSSVDKLTHTVTAETNHFTMFAIIGTPASALTPTAALTPTPAPPAASLNVWLIIGPILGALLLLLVVLLAITRRQKGATA